MNQTPANQAIAVLIDLAQKGEIDPWDVQVIEVIDRFLVTLGTEEQKSSLQQEVSLIQSGQAFLWASMLVLLKADTLKRLEADEELAEDFSELENAEIRTTHSSLPLHLENQLRRRASASPPKKRKVTLKELIAQIQQIATEFEIKPSPKTQRYSSRKEAMRVVRELAHNENLTEIAAHLENFFQYHFPQLAPRETCLDLEQLLNWWQLEPLPYHSLEKTEARVKPKDRVGVFWALLLLSSQSKVELFQEEFYQDLTIKPIT